MLYAFQGAFGSLIAPGFILSGIPRGGTEYLAGIPEQIAQNFTNLIGCDLHLERRRQRCVPGCLRTGQRSGVRARARCRVDQHQRGRRRYPGKPSTPSSTRPGILVNAALNGFEYPDPDPETGTGGYTEWPALLTWAEPGEQGGARVVAGLLQRPAGEHPQDPRQCHRQLPRRPRSDGGADERLRSAGLRGYAQGGVDRVGRRVGRRVGQGSGPGRRGAKAESPAVESPKVETPKVGAPARRGSEGRDRRRATCRSGSDGWRLTGRSATDCLRRPSRSPPIPRPRARPRSVTGSRPRSGEAKEARQSRGQGDQGSQGQAKEAKSTESSKSAGAPASPRAPATPKEARAPRPR